ncbi:type I secretion C-terminal target domain-containing protein, partial [Acinetobacter sp. CFCC 11171]|uniref:type I secretion C-terminal target domain-containing protein n=1 Tax=Acinetobacter sp. CFCC 11171 TaxID=1775558 RepID=UPI0013A6D0D8
TFNDVPVKPDATVLEDGKVTLPNPIEGQPANILINTVTIGGVTTPITHDWNSVVKNPIEVPGVGTLTVTSTGELTFTPVKDFSGMVEIPEITYAYGSTGETITTDAINVQVTAVADQPMVGIFNFDIPTLELNIQTWKNVKNVDGRNLIENAGDGANRDTLINAIDYLRNNTNVTNSDGSIIANAEAGMTGSLNASNLPTFDAVYIHGFVFLEAGQVYKYEGKADDSAAIIIGDGVSTEHVNWKGVNTEADTSFSVSQTGFYSFQFYAHNADGMGNYNFNVTTEDGSAGSAVSYYPSVDAINGLLTDTGYILGDYNAGVDGKDETGFYPIALGYQGNAEDVIQLDGIHVKAMDIDGSEYVSFEMSGLRPGSILSFKDAAGKSHSVTVGADGIANYSPAVQDASASEYTDFTLTVKEKSQEILDVTLTATSTEISNSDKTTSTLDFQVKVLDADGFAGRSMLTAEVNDVNDLAIDEDPIFKVLNQEYALANGEANQVDGFTIGSNDQIDISSLLSDDATEANLAEFVTVEYDEETDSAVISIDRDGTLGTEYESQDLVVLLNQTSKVELDDLINNNQIIY